MKLKEQNAVRFNLTTNKFKRAKTMPDIPHAYTLKKDWANPKDFEDAVLYIRKYGKVEWFYRRQYVYLYTEKYKYWTMGAPLKETILINRAEI